MEIQYRFRPAEVPEKVFTLHLDPTSLDLKQEVPAQPPAWAELEFNKCPNCPLNKEEHPHCPLAVQLVELKDYGKDLLSYEELEVEVKTEGRTISHTTTAQIAISSLMGLITATSGCPHTRFLRPMARFHLPFADTPETVYRAVSMYLLAQYFANKRGDATDLELEGLEARYKHVHTVNIHVAKRLRGPGDKDSAINALTKLDVYSLMMPRKIRASLEDIAHLFQPYIDDSDPARDTD